MRRLTTTSCVCARSLPSLRVDPFLVQARGDVLSVSREDSTERVSAAVGVRKADPELRLFDLEEEEKEEKEEEEEEEEGDEEEEEEEEEEEVDEEEEEEEMDFFAFFFFFFFPNSDEEARREVPRR